MACRRLRWRFGVRRVCGKRFAWRRDGVVGVRHGVGVGGDGAGAGAGYILRRLKTNVEDGRKHFTCVRYDGGGMALGAKAWDKTPAALAWRRRRHKTNGRRTVCCMYFAFRTRLVALSSLLPHTLSLLPPCRAVALLPPGVSRTPLCSAPCLAFCRARAYAWRTRARARIASFTTTFPIRADIAFFLWRNTLPVLPLFCAPRCLQTYHCLRAHARIISISSPPRMTGHGREGGWTG